MTDLAPNSRHGFHLMQFGDMRGTHCLELGTHYNPLNNTHGGPFACNRHLGDSGNIMSDAKGNVIASLYRNEISLIGPFSLYGRGCLVYSMGDDYGLLG